MPNPKNKAKLIKPTARFNNPVVALFMLVFVAIGGIYVLRSFAAGIPVYRTNPDYWRPRIAGCESGSGPNSTPNYKAINASNHTGAYQYDTGTWRGAVGPELALVYPRATDAPPEVQDKAFYSTFARRGTQPWNASYFCWGPGSEPPAEVTPAPPTPAPPAASATNVTVTGRVLVDNKPIKGAKVEFCTSNGFYVNTNDDGRFSAEIPKGDDYCVRVASGIPAGYTLAQSNNNPEHATAQSYEYQKAGENLYHSFWQLFSAQFSWDRRDDSGFVFWYAKQ
ncbi:transglycosylase family protein [bacterium]|nr:transglycosylase family protein [bacterium]